MSKPPKHLWVSSSESGAVHHYTLAEPERHIIAYMVRRARITASGTLVYEYRDRYAGWSADKNAAIRYSPNFRKAAKAVAREATLMDWNNKAHLVRVVKKRK